MGNERSAAAIWPFRDGLHTPDRLVLLQGCGHRALMVRQRCAVRLIQPPRHTPLIGPEVRPTTCKGHGSIVVEGDPPCGIGGVNRSRECLEPLSEPLFRLAQARLGLLALGQIEG
jgi:hypothetical protein